MAKKIKFHIKRSKNKEFFVQIEHWNKNILLKETYKRKGTMLKILYRMILNIKNGNYKIIDDSNLINLKSAIKK